MKKWLPIIVIAVIIIGIFRWGVGLNNTMVEKQETAKTQWANVESAYQRRSDLIPNLVNTVKGYADFEKETLEGVIQARANATKTTIDPTNITPEQMAAFQESQNNLSGALSRLMVVVERYPDLKANQNFLELQSQLEGTENRINVERNRFNQVAKDYNVYIRKFPATVVAGFLNFDPMALFQAAPGSEQAPTVDFN
ncbi:LemA family protein [Lutimonas saemankumensis]|uniref:LemA family protein n=1 Tax=Lutimonas saemankumensis TaxID=483016 RepID=UPI001CD42BB3|nr:LemA family protein [Lutimonas saemankumensis]MCA0932414.1 LemA family protein [Lutimonas saemankumensis]